MTSEAAPSAMPAIRIAAAILCDDAGRVLLVRKDGTAAFMQPGGKIDPGETARDALVRELHEELGLVVDPSSLEPLGTASAPAANEPGAVVEAVLFRVSAEGQPQPRAEIAEILWFDPQMPDGIVLAALTRDRVLPLL